MNINSVELSRRGLRNDMRLNLFQSLSEATKYSQIWKRNIYIKLHSVIQFHRFVENSVFNIGKLRSS